MLVGCNTQLGVVRSTHAPSMVSIALFFVDGQFMHQFKKAKPKVVWGNRGISLRAAQLLISQRYPLRKHGGNSK